MVSEYLENVKKKAVSLLNKIKQKIDEKEIKDWIKHNIDIFEGCADLKNSIEDYKKRGLKDIENIKNLEFLKSLLPPVGDKDANKAYDLLKKTKKSLSLIIEKELKEEIIDAKDSLENILKEKDKLNLVKNNVKLLKDILKNNKEKIQKDRNLRKLLLKTHV